MNGISTHWVPALRRRAFTLIELLVVVAIIAVLAAILLPSLSNARRSARKVYCLNNLRMFAMASNIYADESDNWLMVRSPGGTWYRNALMRGIMNISNASNLPNMPRNLMCPDAVYCLNNPGTDGLYMVMYSYGFNVTDIDLSVDPSTGTIRPFQGYKRTSVTAPGSRMLYADSLDWWIKASVSERYRGEDPAYVTNSAYETMVISYRHDEATNIGFVDGHAEAVARKRVDRLKTSDLSIWHPLAE